MHSFFRNENNRKLFIFLNKNNFNEKSFTLNSLNKFKRSVKLDFSENKIIYLNEQVFKPFFNVNQWNQSNQNYKNRIHSQLLIEDNNLE